MAGIELYVAPFSTPSSCSMNDKSPGIDNIIMAVFSIRRTNKDSIFFYLRLRMLNICIDVINRSIRWHMLRELLYSFLRDNWEKYAYVMHVMYYVCSRLLAQRRCPVDRNNWENTIYYLYIKHIHSLLIPLSIWRNRAINPRMSLHVWMGFMWILCILDSDRDTIIGILRRWINVQTTTCLYSTHFIWLSLMIIPGICPYS